MNRNINKIIVRCAPFLMAVLLVMLSMLPVIAAEQSAQSEITSITLNKKCTDITIEIRLEKEYVKEHKNATLYLFELSPWQSTSELSSIQPAANFKATETAKVTLSYINGNTNRLYSKFLVAEKSVDGSYAIVTSAKYIENLNLLSENTEPYPTTKSKKGLQAQMIPDLQQLGVRHTSINIAINEYIVGVNDDSSVSFVYGGQTYYINRAKLENLDYKVKSLTDSGMNVYFNFILTAPSENASDAVKSLYCDNISSDAQSYALNTRNEIGMKNFQAFMDYMASRYTRADHAYGFVPNFTLGFEVNSGRMWNNAGASSLESSVYSYHTAYRVAYTALTSHYSNGRVYISIGNNWNSPSSIPGAEFDTALDWSAKDYLDFFASVIRNSGDIPWALSINPYPSDHSMTEFWLDDNATVSDSTPFVTMKNLNILTDYMHSDSMTYNGEVRNIIIGEFGLDGDPESNDSQSIQAAAFALAYYTAARNSDIDAFIWHRQVDHSGENLNFGLWTSLDGNVQFPLTKKTIHTVFAQIDTEKSADVTSFVKTLVGSGAFSLFMPDNVKYNQFNVRTVIDATRVDESEFAKGFEKSILFDLTAGSICRFYPTDNFRYVDLSTLGNESETMLHALSIDIPTEYAGIGTVITDPNALKDANYITLELMVEAPSEVAGVYLMLKLQSAGSADTNAAVFNGEVLLKPNTMQTVSFNIKDFVSQTNGNADSLKLWIKTPTSDSPEGTYGLWLKNVELQIKDRISVIGVILIVLLILIVIVVTGYGVLYIRAQSIRKKRRAERERLRREQLRQQALQQNRSINPQHYANPNQYQYRQNTNRQSQYQNNQRNDL